MSERTEIRDGMRVDWDVPITMDDGLVLRADIFRPTDEDPHPVILTYGPYAKGLAFQDGYPSAWQRMVEKHPDVAAGSSNIYQSWEVVDPEKWVPHGYACVRVDSAAPAARPATSTISRRAETRDFYDCIEWAGVQPWSNGKIGLNGISYYGINQWHVASLQPPHLAAMCIWEGAADWYRDMTHHGGMLSTFWANWYDMQVKTVQYGAGERGKRSRVHGELVCGPETLSEEQLAKNRCDFGAEIPRHPLDDDYHKARSPQWDKITAPIFSAANWGGRACIRAAISRDSCARRRRTSGSRRTASSTGPTSTPTTAASCSASSSTSISRRGHRLGQAAARAAAGAPSGREICRARRE
jgi:putative CocE/NonD family hydrolase